MDIKKLKAMAGILTEAGPASHVLVSQVYKMLMTQEFSNWYEGAFMDHVEGEENAKSKDEIIDDLEKML